MDKDYKNSGFGCFVMFVAAVAFIFSVWSLLKWDKHCCTLSGSDTIIMGLSAIITFVVAWQIWQTVASREEIKEAIKAADKIREVQSELIKIQEVSEAHSLRAEANRMFNEPDMGFITFQTYIASLQHYIAGEADFSRNISQVLSRIRSTIENDIANLRSQHWVISNQHAVDENIDDIAASISTMQSNLTQARNQLHNIRNLVAQIRNAHND